jgi:hypothetical protein
MGCRGVHFALDAKTADKLKALATDEERAEYVLNELESDFFDNQQEWLAETDITWDAIHRALTDGYLGSDNGTYPLNHVILGGQSLYESDDYIMSLKTPVQVREIADALRGIDEPRFRSGVLAIDPDDYGFPIPEDECEGILAYFRDLCEFYSRAAGAERYVLFAVSQ